MKRDKPIYIHTPPLPFNKEARPGLNMMVSKMYCEWCIKNPDSTQEQRKEAYSSIYDSMRLSYPSYKEMNK